MEPARREVYRTKAAAEVLGYTIGSLRQLIMQERVEVWPYGTKNTGYGLRAVYNFIPHRAIEANIVARGGSKFIHLPPVWKPLYSKSETMELLDLPETMYRKLVRQGDLEQVHRGRQGLYVTRLSIDDWLERLEAGELSEAQGRVGGLPEHLKAKQFRPPVEPKVDCGWCGHRLPASGTVTVPGRVTHSRNGPRAGKRRVCRACVEARIATVRQVLDNRRPCWLDDAWVEWSKAAELFGIPFDGLQANMASALKAGVVTMADFRKGGVLYSELYEPEGVEPVEAHDSDDVSDEEMVDRLLGA